MRELHGESYALMRKKPTAKEPEPTAQNDALKQVKEVKPIELPSNIKTPENEGLKSSKRVKDDKVSERSV